MLRATAHDQAHNEASTTQRLDGQPMAVTLPLRIPSAMQAGVVQHRRRARASCAGTASATRVRRRVTVLKPQRASCVSGARRRSAGGSTNRDGQGIAGAEVQVLAASAIAPEQLVGVVHTDATGSYSYTAAGSTSRSLRFAYAGSPLILPAESTVRLIVPAVSIVAGQPPSRAQRPAR